MIDGAFFELSAYHLTLVVIGLIVMLARWVPRLFTSREPASAPIIILLGAAAALLLPDASMLPDPRHSTRTWEVLSEWTVIIALFGASIRIDSIRPLRRWIPTARMLLIAMPLTIISVAFLGNMIGGLTLGGAILLGAILAPTDPVLAGEVQVGPPQEGKEHPVRFTLTAEAALNDGLAFPFVYLGLIVATQGFAPDEWGLDWLVKDVGYRIVVGMVMGWLIGRAMGFLLFYTPRQNIWADSALGVIALAGILLCYGLTELVEGYGFIAVTIFAITLRRINVDHLLHQKFNEFSTSLEHSLTSILLISLGMMLPVLFEALTWSHILIAVALIFVIRPISGWIGLAGTNLGPKERGIISAYGVRGIGSIYYLSFAGTHMELAEEPQLWALVALAITLSTAVHGFTVGRVMEKLNE